MHLNEDANFTYTAEALAEKITDKTKLIYLNFPSNPTGGVATPKLLEEIAGVLLKKCSPDIRIYSDEIYEKIIFDGQKHHSIASVSKMAERTIIASGFSKTFAWTGGRIGYAVFPTIEEAEMFKTLNINYFSCVSPYNQEAAREALENPLSAPAVENMVRTFEKRRDIILDKINQIPGFKCQKPGGAFYLFPNISEVCQNLGLIEYNKNLPEKLQSSASYLFQMFALYNHQVAVMDCNSFGKIGSENKHFLRLSIAADLPLLEEGVKRLSAAAKDERGLEDFLTRRPDLKSD